MIMGFSPMGGVLTAPAMGREEAVTEVLFSNGIFDTLYGTGLDERVKPVDQILPPDALPPIASGISFSQLQHAPQLPRQKGVAVQKFHPVLLALPEILPRHLPIQLFIL